MPPALAEFDAFISYRRRDAAGLAAWIRDRLQRFELPDEVLSLLSEEKRELHRRKPKIWLDKAFEKPSDDFLNNKIYPALDAAARLIVLCTPSVFEPIRDEAGAEQPNWLVREVDRFISLATAAANPRPVDVVLGPGAAEDHFPGRLAERQRWDWIDLRGFTWWRSWGLSEELDAGLAKLVAGLYDVPDTALPALRREERRRRRRLLGGITAAGALVVLVVGFLSFSWWAEQQTRLGIDLERRFAAAVELIDLGAIPNAVDALARLVADDPKVRQPEARRLLRAWMGRLVPVDESLSAIPQDRVFRWAGRNLVRQGGTVLAEHEGPPTLLGAVSSDGRRLVSLDADFWLRVRSLDQPGTVLAEVQVPSMTAPDLAELLGGQLLMLQGAQLGLHSDEDSDDAQEGGDSVSVLLEPATGRSVIVPSSEMKLGCDAVTAPSDTAIELSNAGTRNLLRISHGSSGMLEWSVQDGTVAASAATCDPVVVARSPTTDDVAPVLRLGFPAVRGEEAFWTQVGPSPPDADTYIGAMSDSTLCLDQPEPKATCLDFQDLIDKDAEFPSREVQVLRDPLMARRIRTAEMDRVVVTSVTGNQSADVAVCSVEGQASISRCLVTSITARTSMSYLAEGRFLAFNSLELHDGTFILIDVAALKQVDVRNPPMEQLADIVVAPDRAQLAALTRAGEVWLYRLGDDATAAVARRLDFGLAGRLDSGSATTAGLGSPFSSAAFAGADRLVLAGAKGGVALVDLATGSTVWTRGAAALPGDWQHRVFADEYGKSIVLHNGRWARLLSLSHGAPVTGIVDLDLVAETSAQPVAESFADGIEVERDERGSLLLHYHGYAYRPADAWPSADLPTSSAVQARTGIMAAGAGVTPSLRALIESRGPLPHP